MRRSLICLAAGLLALPEAHGTEAPVRRAPHAFTVLSLNVAMREDVDPIVSELTKIGAHTADVILLQEVVQRERQPDMAQQLGGRLGLASDYREAFALDGHRSAGLAMLSRYPWHDMRVLGLKRFNLGFRTRNRIAMTAQVDTPDGSVQVYNVHLDTRINLGQRLEQLDAVARDVGALDRPAIVGGDFNTNNNYWLFHTLPLPFIGRQGAGLKRFMEDHGFHSAFARGGATHDVFGMHLDWVFLKGLQAAAASIHPVEMSDHHALIVSVVPGGTTGAPRPAAVPNPASAVPLHQH